MSDHCLNLLDTVRIVAGVFGEELSERLVSLALSEAGLDPRDPNERARFRQMIHEAVKNSQAAAAIAAANASTDRTEAA